MTGGQEFSFAAGKRTVVHGKRHLYRRLVYRDARERNRIDGIGDGISDVDFLQTSHGHDFSGFRLLHVGPFEP